MDTLKSHRFEDNLHKLLENVGLQQLSRIASSRLQSTAVPNIGQVELASASAFASEYQELYLSMFHGGEREDPELIIQRLAESFAGLRSGLAPYYVVGLRSPAGVAIGAAQFSVLTLRGTESVVPYVQYIYIRPENRRQDLSEVLHTLVLAVATAHAKDQSSTVPFTLFETEPPGHGVTQSTQTQATERTTIHARSGSRAVMLRGEDGLVISGHVQPGLEVGEGPITLIWAIRPSPAFEGSYDIDDLGQAMTAAYYRSLRDEGFPEQNIRLAEDIVKQRMHNRHFIEMQLADVTEKMHKLPAHPQLPCA